MQYGELRANRGAWFISDFLLKLVYFNTYETLKHEIGHSKSSSTTSTSTPMTSSTETDCSDHPPAIVSSESVDRQERGDLGGTHHHPTFIQSTFIQIRLRCVEGWFGG